MVNWKFVHVVDTVAIQSHTFGDQQTMQYFFKPKVFMIILNQNQKIALNIGEQSDQEEEAEDWLFF